VSLVADPLLSMPFVVSLLLEDLSSGGLIVPLNRARNAGSKRFYVVEMIGLLLKIFAL